MLTAFLLAVLVQVPHIQVIDLDGGEPRHLVVVIDGEPYKVVSIPAGSGPVPPPIPGPTPGPVPPTPAPLEGALWVTYIVPDAPSVADVGPTTHAPLRGRIDNKTINWRMQHASDAEVGRRRFEEHAKSAPVTLFQDGTGKILKTVKGNDPQAILDTITTFKGAR